MTRRTERVNGLLRHELSYLISRSAKDPRLTGLITVTEVDTSPDLRQARVFVSVLGSQEEKETTLRGVISASGYLRHELGDRLSLKYIPALTFILDETLDNAQHIYRILDNLDTDPSLTDKPH